MKKNLLLIFFTIFFSACGGGGTATTSSTTKTAYLYDSPINGITYKCGDKINGLTGDSGTAGSFRYQDDCLVQFLIGSKVYLGDIDGSKIAEFSKIFPTNILGLGTDLVDERTEHMLVFLQTLDSDKNISNNIEINSSTRSTLTNSTQINNIDFEKSLNISLAYLEQVVSIIEPNLKLVDTEEALLHFQQTLNKYVDKTINLVNPTPYLVDDNGNKIILNSIKTRGTKEKEIIIKGKSGSKIYLDSNNSLGFIDTNKTIDDDRKGYLILDVNDENKTNFYYSIKLVDETNNSYSNTNSSSILDLNISRDFIPPHIESISITETIPEEQRFFRNINSTDSGLIRIHQIVDFDEDNRSKDYSLFQIDENGTVTFRVAPNYDLNMDAVFSVIARAIDLIGNMTDVLLNIQILNILDNPPAVKSKVYSVNIMENSINGTLVFDLNSSLENNLTKAPDNNNLLSPKYFNLYNYTNIFQINRDTGIITIKDSNNSFFDYETLPNTIDLNVSIENNNTKITPNGELNITYLKVTVNILNKIDTAPKLIAPSIISIDEESSSYSTNYKFTTILKDTNRSDKDLSMTFSIIGGNDDYLNNFDINPTTGELFVLTTNTLDFETTKQYILQIRATNIFTDDNSTHFDEINQTINIIDKIDNAPMIILKDFNSTIKENTPQGTRVAGIEVNGTIADENVTTSYKIISTLKNGVVISDTPFIVSSTGVVTTLRGLLSDYVENLSNFVDTVFKVTLKATNRWWNGSFNESYNESNEVSFDINISNSIDNVPLLNQTVSSEVFEDLALNSLIYDADTNGTNFDENNVTSFSISSGNSAGKFDINTTTGEIKLVGVLDWEALPQNQKKYTLGIKATNSFGTSSEQSLIIDVKNVIEKIPSFIAPTMLNLHENTDIGQVVGLIEINSTQLDEQTINTLNISPLTNGGKFDLNEKIASNGLKFWEIKVASNLDFETNATYNLEINGTNDKGVKTHNIAVNVLDDIEKELPLLVVAIEYNDINLTSTLTNIENLIFTDGTANSKNLKNYFARVSKDKFYFSPAFETYDLNTNGIIKVKLNKDHPLDGATALENDIKSAITIASNDIDFALYDTKKIDGNISSDELQILFVVAGGERTYNDENKSILAKSSSFSSPVQEDGVKIAYTAGGGNYSVVGELHNGQLQTIGLLSKILSQSALKFKKENDSFVFGDFDIMGSGYNGIDGNETAGATPVQPSVYNKIIQGWTTPITLKKDTAYSDLVFNYANSFISYNTYKIEDSIDPNIYYLLEYRDSSPISTTTNYYDNGLYKINSSIFNGGLMVWKVDNNINATKTLEALSIDNNDKIFRPSNDSGDLFVNNGFEFINTSTDEINANSHTYTIGIKTK